jgi:hypothetical protein
MANPTTCPQANAFYCCQCHDGPWQYAIYLHCQSCGHAVDQNCSPGYVAPGYSASRDEPVNTQDLSPHSNEPQLSPVSNERQLSFASAEYRQNAGTEWLWSCCYCQRGTNMNCNINPQCWECAHERCSSCAVYQSADVSNFPKFQRVHPLTYL